MTQSTEAMDLYQDTLSCIGRDSSAPTPGLGILRSGVLQTIEQLLKKDQAKHDQAKGTLEFQLDTGQYIQARELMSFTFALDVLFHQLLGLRVLGVGAFVSGVAKFCAISAHIGAGLLSLARRPARETNCDAHLLGFSS